MSTYVMSDIHGCYDEMQDMLKQIDFKDTDDLVIAGDYIDRGPKSRKMLKWISKTPANVSLVRGNHEEEFMMYVQMMVNHDEKLGLKTDPQSHEDVVRLYEEVKKTKKAEELRFDMYGTIEKLVGKKSVTLQKLTDWADRMAQMPYYIERTVNGRDFIVVHAGWIPSLRGVQNDISSLRGFYLYARGESVTLGGKEHSTVVAGHTPTVSKKRFAYNKGRVFTAYNEAKDCRYYDIDCGCWMRTSNPDARLACLRLEDEKVFYV